MENHDKKQNIAYLRSVKSTSQCELTFHLCDSINGIAINEEIKAVRSMRDTVGSMLQHIRNKLNKLIKTKSQDEACTPAEIPLRLEYKDKIIEGSVLLKEIIEKRTVHVFCILKEKFKVVVNAPLVQTLVLPAVIFKNSIIQPRKFDAVHTVKQFSSYEWYSSVDKENWVKVGDKYTYKIKDGDMGRYLKLRCLPISRKEIAGPVYEVVSEGRVMAVPEVPKSPFHDRHLHTKSKLTGNQFRVVSYNTLSKIYTKHDRYPYCPAEFLSMEYRKKLLLEEIAGYKADIICLQELDYKEHEHFFRHKFNKLNYKSVYHPKGDTGREGMCCFYNEKKFELIHSEQLVLSEHFNLPIFAQIRRCINYGPDVEKLRQLVTSLQVTVLQSRTSNRRIIVANTHLHYHPDAYQIRVVQVAMVAVFLEKLQQQFSVDAKIKISVLFCGDFNSTPSSAVYDFLINGKVENGHHENLTIINNREAFTHPFDFNSACGTPKYTNYTEEFKDCLDYIFYDKRNLELLRFVPFPDESVLSQNIALPSKMFPSDHLALVADFRFS